MRLVTEYNQNKSHEGRSECNSRNVVHVNKSNSENEQCPTVPKTYDVMNLQVP